MDPGAAADVNQGLPSDGAQQNEPPVAPSPGQSAAQTAPSSQPNLTPGATAGETAKANPANGAPVSLMVQIAAVSHSEDADVLVAALLKRGYAVTADHDAGDGLIHVRVGPFTSRDEADKWRLKLLNDGYNAIVQP
jgi:cell division septation protein DedD